MPGKKPAAGQARPAETKVDASNRTHSAEFAQVTERVRDEAQDAEGNKEHCRNQGERLTPRSLQVGRRSEHGGSGRSERPTHEDL